jgi:hypothetical protein
MKKLFLMMLLSVSLFAQKKRTTTFDADTTTRPDAGFYGIGVRDAQPYLIRPSGNALMLEVRPTKIAGWQFNTNGTAPKSVQILTVNKDSLTIDLPDATDTTNRSLTYSLFYLGYNRQNQFKVADANYLLTFADTIFAYSAGNKTTYWTKTFTHNHAQSFFRIEPFSALYLYVDKKRWWLSGNAIKY